MNRLLLLLLPMLTVAIYGYAESRYWNRGRGYEPFSNATASGILLDNNSHLPLLDSCSIPHPSSDLKISFRIDNRNAHPSRKYSYTDISGHKQSRRNPEWGFFLTDLSGSRLYVIIRSQEVTDALSSTPATTITTTFDKPGYSASETIISNGSIPFAGETLWHLTLKNGKLHIAVGAHELNELPEYALPEISFSNFGYMATPGAKIMVSDISLTTSDAHEDIPVPIWNNGTELAEHIRNTDDTLEGYWALFDRSLEESLLMMGGDYRLAIVKDDNRYAIIYLDGARVNTGIWKQGMIKGYITPTVFPNVYDVEWFDSEGKALKHEVKGQYGDGDTFTIQFPYQDSTIRLRKASPAS